MMAVIAVIVAGVVALVLVGLVAALLMWLLRALAMAAIILLGGAVLLAVAVTVIAVAAENGAEPALAGLFGVAAAVLALLPWLAGRWRAARPGPSPSAGAPMEWHAERPVDEPPGHDALAAAWARAMELAPGNRADLRRARSACARLLVLAEPTHHDDLLLVTVQVPAGGAIWRADRRWR